MRFPEPYRPPTPGPEIDLDLSRNEGRPPSTSILDTIEVVPEMFNRYPDSRPVRDLIARVRSVAPDRVLVTAGGDDALLRCCSGLLRAGTRMVTTSPTFEMVARYGMLQEADVIEVSWKDEPFPLDAFVAAARPGAVAVLVAPNNPTGETFGPEVLAAISAAFEYVVIDGAYVEFADIDLTATALSLNNVLMVRTMSKAWGLAGLRVGYLLGEEGLVRKISAYGNPYPVSRVSLAFAAKLLESEEPRNFIEQVCQEREALTALLRQLGETPIDSQANFVFFENDEAVAAHRRLAESGIAVRRFPGAPGLERALRITVPGNRAEFDRLSKALIGILSREKELT